MSGLGLDLIIVLAGAGVLALLLLALRGGVELLPLGLITRL